MTKLVIFDLDGTLLDTIEDLANSVNFALQQHNFPAHPVEAFRFFVGNGVNKLLERALPEPHRNADMVSMLKADFIQYYFTHSDEFTKPYPGITELVGRLYKEGYKLAVASNKVHAATVDLVKKFFPNIEFAAMLGQREGFPVKPDPAILEEIIQVAGVEKTEVLYAGDSGVDAATAYNAKVPFVGVLWGFRPRKELEDVGATVFVENAEELYELVVGGCDNMRK
ncbi:MAG: HAD family hydrolase [Paludibacter sp.]